MPEFSPALYRAGAGEPLVLVHGFTATWRCWLPVLPFLVPRFDVIAPTLHGHDGGPSAPRTAHSIADAADHFELLLDELGVGDAHFAGNSMGGALSLEMAKRGRARSVVAISPGGGWAEDDTREADRLIRLFTFNQRSVRAMEKLLPTILSPPALAPPRAAGHHDPREPGAHRGGAPARALLGPLRHRRGGVRHRAQRQRREPSTSTRCAARRWSPGASRTARSPWTATPRASATRSPACASR